MNDVLGPFVAHELQDFFELLEVQVLLGRDDIDVLIEIVGVLSVLRAGQISGDIQR